MMRDVCINGDSPLKVSAFVIFMQGVIFEYVYSAKYDFLT